MADYLKIPELAQRLDVSEKTARRYVKAGALPSTFIGGAYRVTEVDLEAFLRGAEVKPEDASPKAESPSSLEPSLFNGLEGGLNLKASFWIECLNTQADLCGRVIAHDDYDLETVWVLEGAMTELWGVYRLTVRKLVHQWRTPGQADALQQAEDRMKAARTATRQAYGERRDAEEDRQKVVELDARRQLREERYADQGYANAGT
ncbi:MAG: helix-turn-helix domain-containing protein [Rubrobacteraceae bacterium]|nr:helix-turn-helix domain-containing protein [Rubrobacteraceae bacterium]